MNLHEQNKNKNGEWWAIGYVALEVKVFKFFNDFCLKCLGGRLTSYW